MGRAVKLRPIAISPAQAAFRKSRAWLRGFVGGRGAGKTKVGCLDIAARAGPGEPWMCVSPDNSMVRETTLPTFIETVEQTGQYVRHVLSPVPRVWFRPLKPGKPAQLVFRGAERPDKLRGPSKAGLWFDEASIIPQEAFEIGIAVCRYRGKMGPVLATFTPRGTRHWTFERFFRPLKPAEEEASQSIHGVQFVQGRAYAPQPDTELIRCASRDNPFLPQEFVHRIAQNYSSALALQELEGEFMDISGAIFRREWLQVVQTAAPAVADRVRYWDKAASADSGCYTVGLLMAHHSGRYWVEDVVRGQWSAHQRNRIIAETAQLDAARHGGAVLTFIEQEGGGDGKAVAEQLIRMLSQFPVYRDVVSGGGGWVRKGHVRLPGEAKVRRALPFAAQAEAGNVSVLAAEWTRDYLDELTLFPEYRYADQVDASSGAYNKLQTLITGSGDAPTRFTKPDDRAKFGEALHVESETEMPNWKDLPWNQ